MAVELDRPSSAENLYFDRGEPIEPWRPIMTGDVFANVTVPGCDRHELMLVLSHPCSLRADGVQLVERVQALPVAQTETTIPLEAWKGHFRVMPLPALREDDRHYAARLTEFGMIAAADLDLDRRLAALTEDAVTLLQQRFFHNQSRVRVGLDTLHSQGAPAFVEIELWMQWNEELAAPRVVSGEKRTVALAAEGHAFDEVMRGHFEPDLTLREALKTPRLQAGVRRRVREAIQERCSG